MSFEQQPSKLYSQKRRPSLDECAPSQPTRRLFNVRQTDCPAGLEDTPDMTLVSRLLVTCCGGAHVSWATLQES